MNNKHFVYYCSFPGTFLTDVISSTEYLPPARFNVGIMMFFACWVNYMLRVNLSVAVIAMVPDKAPPKSINPDDMYSLGENVTEDYGREFEKLDQPEGGSTTFEWTAHQQALVLSSYFWGYSITCLLGGLAAEYFGPKRIILLTMLITAITTLASPMAARIHYAALIVVRFFGGFAGGFLFPALHAIMVHWAPPVEKGKFVSALVGGAIGTCFTWSVSGPVMEALGWESAFYLPGFLTLVWCVCWWYLVYDSPIKHPRITEEEKTYILTAIGDRVTHAKVKFEPPFKSIFTSLPFLAMAVLHYGNNWGLYFIMTAAPKFVSGCLKFNLTKTGTMSSLPYLARMFMSLIFGSIGDWIMKKKLMSTLFIRKFFTLFSHIIPGTLLLLLGYSASPYVSVALITMSMGINGAATLTNLVNHQDLAPNFAGTLFGIANGVGNTAGFITPMVTAHFTKHGNGYAEWRPVFIVGASFYIGAAIFFILFGKADTQAWNYPKGQSPPPPSPPPPPPPPQTPPPPPPPPAKK